MVSGVSAGSVIAAMYAFSEDPGLKIVLENCGREDFISKNKKASKNYKSTPFAKSFKKNTRSLYCYTQPSQELMVIHQN